jgi:zinc resistance-associated protein
MEIDMTRMRMLAGATAMVLAGSTLAAPAQEQLPSSKQDQWAGPQEDVGARANGDLGRLKDMLRLTPEQERNWPAFDSALRDLIKLRLDRTADLRDQPLPGTPVERLRRRADQLSGVTAALKRLADAAEPLYASLDDGQKQRFARLSSIARDHIAMLEERMREGRESMRGGRGVDDRDGRDSSRYGDDETSQRQGDAAVPRELIWMYRDMRRMYRDVMRATRGEYGDRRGWRDRDSDRWSDREERQQSYGRGMEEGRRSYGRGMTEGWRGRDRYDDDDER